MGLLDTVTVSGPGGVTFQQRVYGYHTGKGLLTSIKLGGQATSFAVDNNFNPTGVTFPGGETRSITQGGLETPIKFSTSAAYNSTIERWLGYNALGQVQWHMTYPNAEFGRKFAYDSLGRLRTGWPANRSPGTLPGGCPSIADGDGMSDGSCPSYSLGGPETVTYDAVGNRTDKSGTYTTGNRITGFDGCTYKTDAEGNVISRRGSSPCVAIDTLLWTAEGQLDSLKLGSGTGVKFLYDAEGRLVLKRVNGVAQASFLWDGPNLLAELNGTATAKVAEYSYYPGLDNLHALVVGTTRYYAHVDGLGNVIALTDESKQVQRTYTYTDWGVGGGTDTRPFSGADRARWKGALWLGPEAELYYMRNRWYEPHTGRFLSEDPIGLEGGINPVIFAGGDPVNGGDPLGLECVTVVRGYTYEMGRELKVTSHQSTVCLPSLGNSRSIVFRPSVDYDGEVGGGGRGSSRGLWDRLWNPYPDGCIPGPSGCAPVAIAGVPDWATPGTVGRIGRSLAARNAFLKGNLDKFPRWMRGFIARGRVPPGYQVDHRVPLSVGGSDLPSNMRLLDADMHRLWHKLYHPWRP